MADEQDNVVFRYTDAQAVEDGVLVKTGKTDRVTRPVFEWFAECASVSPEMGQAERDSWADVQSSALISKYGDRARKVYDENIGGGILKIRMCREFGSSSSARTLWLMPNENGGLTLMFPEDY
jgi:hypothetical protein